MDNTAARSATTPIPAEVLDILGDPPILSTEDGARYHAMLAAFAQQVDPGDFITWCYIKDLADYRAEIWRFRRMKAQAIENAHRSVVDKRVGELRVALADAPAQIAKRMVAEAGDEIKRRGLHGDERAAFEDELEPRIVAAVEARQQQLRADIERRMAYQPDESDLASLLHVWIGPHQTFDQQIGAAEAKYAAALHDLERHLFGFGRALRGELHKIIDGEIVTPAFAAIPGAQAHGMAGVTHDVAGQDCRQPA